MNDNSTAYTHNFQCTFNPLDKVVELYERLLQLERDKVELLKNKLKQQEYLISSSHKLWHIVQNH